MAEVLDARVVAPEEAATAEAAGHDLVGFGSGVFAQRMRPYLLAFVRALPASSRRAFAFATRGLRSWRSRRTPVRWCGSSTTRDSRSRAFSPGARSTRGRRSG
ncbi:hypothetical protein OG749_41405 [Streptomyces nojiriensis]